VLIVAPANDFHAAAVVTVLKRRHVATEWIDTAELNKALRLNCSLDDSVSASLTLPGRRLSLSDFGTVWWRRPRCPANNENLDENHREFVRNEWEHFLGALEVFVPARWVNPPGASYLADRKARQLAMAHALGLRVPRTAISNDADTVRSLAAEGVPLIYKSIGNGAHPVTITRPLLSADLERLDVLHNCPAIFQERIEARADIRVTAMGDSLYAAEIDSQAGDARLDWRLDHSVAMRPHRLDTQTETRLTGLMKSLGLAYGAIDLRLTPQGEYVFLEVNPGGQFLFLELVAGMPLSELMADFLAVR
jgi:glutathione synthase/RimK-type ligase-like ATP-grasp enzyme